MTIPRLMMTYNYSILQKGVDRNSLKSSFGDNFIRKKKVGTKQENSKAVNFVFSPPFLSPVTPEPAADPSPYTGVSVALVA